MLKSINMFYQIEFSFCKEVVKKSAEAIMLCIGKIKVDTIKNESF